MAPTDTFSVIHVGNAIESGFVKSLLEEYGIPAFLRDEMMGSIAPWSIAPGGAGAVKILIARSDYERAKAILDEFLDDEDVAHDEVNWEQQENREIHASWKALTDFQSGQTILYPTGLLDFLQAADKTK